MLLVTTVLAQYRFDNLEYFLMQEQAYEDAGLLSYEYQELESSGDYTPGSVSSGRFREGFGKILFLI